jgi:hypothetical protein
MSRSRPQNDPQKNPAQLFLKWRSSEKAWEYWDKNANEGKGASVIVPMDTPFIVLDQLNTVTGYDDATESNVWGTEVRNTRAHKIVAFAGSKKIAEGLWADIKSDRIKFAKSVYALAKINGEFILVNFKMAGCANSAWIDFEADAGGSKELYGETVVAVADIMEGKKGGNKFNQPVFKVIGKKLSDKARSEAAKADETLQDYLDDYLHREPTAYKSKDEEEPEVKEEIVEELPPDDEEVPF